jgi:hypothetical protein
MSVAKRVSLFFQGGILSKKTGASLMAIGLERLFASD